MSTGNYREIHRNRRGKLHLAETYLTGMSEAVAFKYLMFSKVVHL
jgi:hypothetical protein